jgi:hypothetical protein
MGSGLLPWNHCRAYVLGRGLFVDRRDGGQSVEPSCQCREGIHRGCWFFGRRILSLRFGFPDVQRFKSRDGLGGGLGFGACQCHTTDGNPCMSCWNGLSTIAPSS